MSSWCSPCCLFGVLAAFQFVPAATSSVEHDLDGYLKVDDECAASDGECALNAMQKKIAATEAHDTTHKEHTNGTKRKGSFLVVGDWGFDWGVHGKNVNSPGCQEMIGRSMLAKMRELGDVKFIINVGDSFYPRGVRSKNDPQWDHKWRERYPAELRSIPWYSVYGNHDYLEDPCACSSDTKQCAQVNADINNLNYFYMPDVNWFKEHHDLDLEVIGLDTNDYMWAYSNESVSQPYQCAFDCQYTKCQSTCEKNLKRRSNDGIQMLKDRAAKSTAKNLVVFSHYPTDYFFSRPDFISALKDDSKHKVNYFGGHRHNTDDQSTMNIWPNTNWIVGGGGGWSCDGPDQGFVVGEISESGDIKTYSVLEDPHKCCHPPPSMRLGGWDAQPIKTRPWWRKCMHGR